MSGVVKTREGCRDCGVPLGRCFEGHQRIGDGLGHLGRGAIVGELGVRVALGLVDGRHDGGGDFGSREVICQGRGDGVVGLLRGVRIAAEAEGPVVVGELDAQGARGVEVADLVGPGQQVPGSNVLRNLSVAGALTATFQNLDDTILIESDSYARSETYTQAETGAAITAAIDALDLSQFQNEAEVQALIATALAPYWDQTEVSTYVAGELANYATSSSVTSAISSALSSYDNSSQVDSKIVTALLDFYTRTEVDQQIANALGNVDLSNYYTQAETQSYVASELLAYYPRTELDSQLTATFTQYWTSSRTQMEIDDAIAGAGFLTQALADQRYFAVSANASFESLVRTNVTPPMIKALLPRAPLAASTILTETTLELTCDAYSKAESDGRYLSNSNFAPLDARYFVRNPAVAEGNGLFHLVQEQFTPRFI